MALYNRVEQYDEKAISSISEKYKSILGEIGEDVNREGLIKTPERVAKALAFMTSGMDSVPSDILKSSIFTEDNDEMVLVRNIEVFSLCEHHMLPFFGKAHVAYIPNGKIVGLSKIPRIVDSFARRLQVQERLTEQIRDCINDTLEPRGVAVVIEAQHLCMQMRGVEKQNSLATTSTMLGKFRESVRTRNEFMSLINRFST